MSGKTTAPRAKRTEAIQPVLPDKCCSGKGGGFVHLFFANVEVLKYNVFIPLDLFHCKYSVVNS